MIIINISKKKTILFLLVLVLICPVKLYDLLEAQEFNPGMDLPLKSLFQAEEPLHLNLTMDMKSVFSNREAEKSHPAEISYTDAEGNKISLPIKISVRGDFRKDSNNCDFPPLRLNFSNTTVINTIFEGQDKIKLVTHCRSRPNRYEQNVLKEYLAYKLYNLFSKESYFVRLAQLKYADITGKLDTLTRLGFLIEPTAEMAHRNGCEEIGISKIMQNQTSKHKTTVLAIFQYMIGNTDWSVWNQQNIDLITEDTSVAPIVVPFDFDWSGLVNAPYAVPSGSLPSVRTRLYRNFCLTDAELQLALDEFRLCRDEVYRTCRSVPFLSPKELKKTLKYIDDFYRIIENPKKVVSEFHLKCWIL
jgi:hypothetical protein